MNPFETTVPKLERVTDRYAFVNTNQFIEDMKSLGYDELTNERRMPRKGLGMHSMVFSHPQLPSADGLQLRIVATNSHDATSAFRLFIQVLVQVCSNGLMAWRSDGTADTRIIHVGYALDKVKAAVDAVNGRVNGTLAQVNDLCNIQVAPEQAAEYLKRAVELRPAKPFHVLDLQKVVFPEQAENNAWNLFNRVQHSLINGGYVSSNEVDKDGVTLLVPGRKAREITAVRERVVVNTKLWELSVESFLK